MFRPFAHSICALIAAFTSACTGFPPASQSDNKFLINGMLVTVKAEELQRLRAAWTPNAASAVAPSTVPNRHLQWVLDFIALSHAVGTAPCRKLELVSVLALPFQEIRFQASSGGPVKTANPVDYYESWLVQACGKRAFWRVYMDPSDGYDTPTVVLWRQS